MKVLFTLHSTAHYAYHESTIRALLSRGHEVRVLFAKEGSVSPLARVLDRLPQDGPRPEVGWLTHRADRWRRLLVPARALRSYSSYLRQPEQSDYYRARWQRRLGTWLESRVERPLFRRALASSPAFRALGAIERLAPPARPVLAELSADRPDVVVSSPANLRNPEEIEYVKAARRLGIPTVLPVLSWDNLTTKGLIHVVPDLTLAWNETHRGEAVRVHGVPPGRVAVTGSPFFDAWFDDAARVEARADFCQRVGLDPERPFAVYLGSSKNIARDETWLVRAIAGAVRAAGGAETAGLQLLVRPHPANAAVYAALDEPDVVVWPKAGQLPDSDAAREEFRATLMHAVAAVGINTSGMIDAVIADRPCVAVVVEEYDATQREAVHFTHLVEARTLEVADGPAACAAVLGRLLRGEDETRDARRRFVEAFVRPRGLGTPAGELMAVAIELAARRMPGDQIDATLAAQAPLVAA